MLSLDNLINTCLKLLLKKNQAPEKKRLVSFIKERFYALFNDHPKDLLDSVLSSNFDNLTDVQRRIIELSQIRDKDSFEQSRVIVERTANMLKSLPGADVKLSNVDPSLFKEKEEEDLNRIFISFRDSTDFILRSKKYKEFTEIFARDFFRKLNSFFDVVRVNVEDEKIKLNRLALLAKINKIYSDNVANLALIVKTEHK